MSQLTKRALAQSLKNLLAKKPLNKITIHDITADCGINRMTFYYHFKDIYDLVEWVCLEDVRRVLQQKIPDDTWQQGFLRIFEAVQKNKTMVMNVYCCIRQEQVEKCLKPLLDRLVLKIICEEYESRDVKEEDKEFIAKAYSYVFIGLILDWIKADMQEEPEKIVGRLSMLIQGSMASALERFKT